MPVNIPKLQEVHGLVREIFKGSLKSGNKRYAMGDRDAKGVAAPPGSAGAVKRRLRNKDAERASREIERLRAHASLHDPFLYGVMLITRFMESAGRMAYGNCHEMTSIAGAFVIDIDAGVPWFCAVRDPGDHALLVVTAGERPRWDCVANFRNDRSGAWVIDGWANICCPLRDYETALLAKLDKWTAEGKRIRYVSRVYRADCWMVPNALAYRNGLRFGPVSYRRVRKPAGFAFVDAAEVK